MGGSSSLPYTICIFSFNLVIKLCLCLLNSLLKNNLHQEVPCSHKWVFGVKNARLQFQLYHLPVTSSFCSFFDSPTVAWSVYTANFYSFLVKCNETLIFKWASRCCCNTKTTKARSIEKSNCMALVTHSKFRVALLLISEDTDLVSILFSSILNILKFLSAAQCAVKDTNERFS